MYALVELKKLENTVMIGMATKSDTKNELIYQKFGFLLIICKGLRLKRKNVK